jgi:membrane protein YqaA with SNARE-associated domain
MSRIAELLRTLAESYGGVGLAFVAFLDSSFLSIPEVNDLAIIALVLQHPPRWLYYATLTTSGSLLGCFTLYSIGRRGGEALLHRRFSTNRVERALAAFRRYGVLAVIVPSMLPPPMPFKIFVLLAGVTQVKRSTFVASVIAGRGTRYLGIGLMTYWYGERAARFIRGNLATVSVWLAVAIVVAAIGIVVWRRARAT